MLELGNIRGDSGRIMTDIELLDVIELNLHGRTSPRQDTTEYTDTSGAASSPSISAETQEDDVPGTGMTRPALGGTLHRKIRCDDRGRHGIMAHKDYLAATACGQEMSTTGVTRQADRVRCPDCRVVINPERQVLTYRATNERGYPKTGPRRAHPRRTRRRSPALVRHRLAVPRGHHQHRRHRRADHPPPPRYPHPLARTRRTRTATGTR